MKALCIASAVAIGIALFDMPYGYYQLLRVGVCIASIFVSVRAFDNGREGLGWLFAALALTYNPLAPLALGRELWTIVNIATIVAFLSVPTVDEKTSSKNSA